MQRKRQPIINYRKRQPISNYVVIVSLIIGGLAGAYCGYLIGFDDSHYHRDTAAWLDLSDLGPWAGLIVGGMIGVVAGVAQVFMLESTVRLPLVGCLAVFIVVDGAICAVVASNVQIDEAAITQRDNAIQAAIQGQANQTASDYTTLSAHLDELQYPDSSVYHWQTDDPFQFTTNDDQDTVAAYYQHVLGISLRKTGVVMGPAYETWEVMSHYAGVPIHVIIGKDQLSDGAKTEVTLSETTEAEVSAWSASNRATPAATAPPAPSDTHSILPPAAQKAPEPQSPGSASTPAPSPAASSASIPSSTPTPALPVPNTSGPPSKASSAGLAAKPTHP